MKALYILREDRNAQALYAFLKANWRACAEQGKPLAVEIKPEKTKRSLEQNAFYWKLLGQVAEQAWYGGRQFRAEDWHEQFRDLLLPRVDLPMGKSIPVSTTTLSVGEFTEYVNRVEAFAAQELGVQFLEGVA